MYPVTNVVIIPLLIAEDERRREHEVDWRQAAEWRRLCTTPDVSSMSSAKQAPNKHPIAQVRRLILGRA